MPTPQIVNTWSGAWTVPDGFVQTQPSNQMLNIGLGTVTGGHWLICMTGWHEVPSLQTTVTVGDDASNYWIPLAVSPATQASSSFFLNQNYSFQSGSVSPWTIANGTLTTTNTTVFGNNAFSGRIVNNGVSASVTATSGKANITNEENSLVSGSAYVWFTSTVTQVHVDISWFNSVGGLISTTTGANNTIPAGQWTNVTTLATAPGGAVTASINVVAGGTPSATNIWYLSNAGISEPNVINQNPYFTTTPPLTDWAGSGATLTSSTTTTFNGFPSIEITPNLTSSQVGLQTAVAQVVPVTVNQFYTGTGYLYSPAGYDFTSAGILWYNGSNVIIGTNVGNFTYIPPNMWTPVTVSAQAPAGAVAAAVGVFMYNHPQIWDIMYAAQVTLTEAAGFSAYSRCSIWAAPNIASSTTQVSISPLGQATGLASVIWEVSGMPSWLEVDTASAEFTDLSANIDVTLTPSQSDFWVATAAANLAKQWTLDRVSLNGWQPIHWSQADFNNNDTVGDIYVKSTGLTSSVANTATFYSVNPLNNNPVFSTSVTGWSATNATITSVTGFGWPQASYDPRLSSTSSAKLTPNGTSSTCNMFVSSANAPAATPTLAYMSDFYLYSPSGWSTYSMGMLWFNSSHSVISSNVGPAFTVPANTWTNTFFSAVAPANTAFASPVIIQNNTPPTSAFTYVGRGTITQANGSIGLGLSEAAVAIRLTPQNQPATVNPNWPYLKLEAAFGYPSSTPPDQLQYTDISNRLLSVTIRRGRQYELNSLQAGEADFVLRNDDGFLTPNNPKSPYTIGSYTPIRITATWQGKIFPVFIGYMERWPEVWKDPHWGEINAVGVDAWAMFVGISPSIVKGERLLDSPFGYWPCGDGNSSTTAVNIGLGGNTTPLTVMESINGAGSSKESFGDNTLKLPGDSGTNWVMSGLLSSQTTNGFSLWYNGPPLPALNQGVCVTWWAYIQAPLVQSRNSIFTAVGFGGPILQVWMDPGTGIHVTTWNTAGVQTDHTPSSTFGYSNEIVFFMLNFSNTGYTLYINGTDTLTGTDTMANRWAHFSFCGRVDQFSTGNFSNMAISHIAVYPRQLDFSRVVTYMFSGTNGMADDFGDWRVSRLMSYMLWTVAHRVYYDDPNGALSGATDISGKDIGSAINDVANTERGLLYVDKAGYVTYRTRNHALDRGIQAVFGENTAAGELPYLIDIELDFDPQYVYNDIQVTHKGTPALGQTSVSSPIIYAKNLNSIYQYGDRSQQLTSYFNDITQSVNLSNWMLNQYSQPQPRVQQVSFDPRSNPAMFTTLLELDVGDRVTLNRRPVGASSISLDVTIIGVHHDINWADGKWTVTYDLMPTSIAALAVKTLTFDNPSLDKLDSTNVIGW